MGKTQFCISDGSRTQAWIKFFDKGKRTGLTIEYRNYEDVEVSLILDLAPDRVEILEEIILERADELRGRGFLKQKLIKSERV